MKHPHFAMHTYKNLLISVIVVTLLSPMLNHPVSAENSAQITPPKPALTVTVATPQRNQLAHNFTVNGNVLAWQEAIVGNETDGLRLNEVRVNVGDNVKRGQVLATFATDMLQANLAQIQANVAEAEAAAAEATANAARAHSVAATGALSEQQINQYLSAEKTANAKLLAQRAAIKTQQLRLVQTQVLAPDSGVISARTATLGAVLPKGQELFRLIRQNRLEWLAEVTAAELAHVPTGAGVDILTANGHAIKGKVRMIAPTINPQTRLGLVYVDLPTSTELKAGMFLNGTFALGSSEALTVSQQAVVIRDGFNYMFRLNKDNRVTQVKVEVGRRSGERIEIRAGLAADAIFVVNGAGFLNDGDIVKVVDTSPPAALSVEKQPSSKIAPTS